MGEKNENVHAGHRQRMRRRFIERGFQGMEQHEVLEMLLFYGVPRKDTNVIGHRMIDCYGSFAKVCDAPIDILTKRFGISESAAVLIKMVPELARVYTETIMQRDYIDKDIAVDLLRPKFIGACVEKIAIALSDANDRLLFCEVIAEGSLTATESPVRKIVDLAIRHNARYVYLAHNHPSGHCVPSRQDLIATHSIFQTLDNVGVMLVDHIIFTSQHHYSIRSYRHYSGVFTKDNHAI